MIQILTEVTPQDFHLYHEIYALTQGLNATYPHFKDWYYHTFLTGLMQGTRRCFFIKDRERIIGCCLLKDTPTEKKICTLYVAPDYRKQGIGTSLLQTALQGLSGNIKLTVSATHQKEMIPILRKFNFHLGRTLSPQSPQEFEYVRFSTPVSRQNRHIPPKSGAQHTR